MSPLRHISLLLLVYWLIKALLYAAILPPWFHADELFVSERALLGGRHDPVTTELWTLERAGRTIDAGVADPVLRKALQLPPTGSAVQFLLNDPVWRRNRSEILRCPTPYFSLLQVWTAMFRPGSPQAAVYAGRLLSVALGGATLLMIFLAARSFFPRGSPGPTFAAAIAALTPPLTAAMTVATPVALQVFLFSSFLALLADAWASESHGLWRLHTLFITALCLACGGLALLALPLLVLAALLRPRPLAAAPRALAMNVRFFKVLAVLYLSIIIWTIALSRHPLPVRDWALCALAQEIHRGFDAFTLPSHPPLPRAAQLTRAVTAMIFPYYLPRLEPGLGPVAGWSILLAAALGGWMWRGSGRRPGRRERLGRKRLRYVFWLTLYGPAALVLGRCAAGLPVDGRRLTAVILPFSLLVIDGLLGVRPSNARLALAGLLILLLLLIDVSLLGGVLIPGLLL